MVINYISEDTMTAVTYEINLDQLDHELGLDDLDGPDLWDDDADLIELEFVAGLEAMGGRPATRRDAWQLKTILRDHPAALGILADWDMDGQDAVALEALGELLEGWGVPVRPDGQDAPSGAEGAAGSLCDWPGCTLPPKPRKGTRGRIPRHCEAHTLAKKRKDDRERIKAKRAGTLQIGPCCREWVNSGHRGKCSQCRAFEAESKLPYALTAIERTYFEAGGFHLV
jgi:hypothetical protein